MGYLTPLLVLCLAGGVLNVRANENPADVDIGDTVDQVHQALGQPRGWLKSETLTVLQYERGRIEIVDGAVTRVSLLSPEEAAARRKAREQEARRLQAEHQARRERLIEQGTALKLRVLSDTTFLNASADAQVTFWESFRQRFPDVPADMELIEARNRRRDAEEKRALEKRMMAMEQQVARAEQRTREAEEEAERTRRQRRTYVSYSTPFYDRYYPLCHRGNLTYDPGLLHDSPRKSLGRPAQASRHNRRPTSSGLRASFYTRSSSIGRGAPSVLHGYRGATSLSYGGHATPGQHIEYSR